jgi:hypothetical protein
MISGQSYDIRHFCGKKVSYFLCRFQHLVGCLYLFNEPGPFDNTTRNGTCSFIKFTFEAACLRSRVRKGVDMYCIYLDACEIVCHDLSKPHSAGEIQLQIKFIR